MISIRPEQAGDDIRGVTARAFGDERVADLVDVLAAGPGRCSLVAVDGGATVVGHTMLSRGWVDAAQELVEVLILSPLSVEPDRQRQGIGAQLVRAALEQGAASGAPAVFLEGSPTYYQRFGFERGDGLGFTRPSVRIPEVAFQVVLLPAWQPWMTGALVYPEAFWAMDFAGLRD